MTRLQKSFLNKDLDKKMVFLAGPRQVGKTTLAKSFASLWPDLTYLNFDSDKDRSLILKQEWNRKSPLVILDEIHKLKKWKSKLKGVYDTEGIPPRLLVTGSARLDLYRRGGDSLSGRYFLHRLYPFSVRELKGSAPPKEILDQLMLLGGFPEPFFSQSIEAAKRWRKQHIETIVREDVQDLEPVRNIQTLLLLVNLLRQRVGSTISYGSLAGDLEVSPHTVKHWIQILENMYILFRVPPYHRNLARAILKEPKIYFYDTGSVQGDEGAKLENAVAVSLRKWLHFLEDTKGMETQLHYIRDKEKREVDFAIFMEGKLETLLEVKLADGDLHKPLVYYSQKLKPRQTVQLVHQQNKIRSVGDISIHPAAEWLNALDI
ncbi:MAG: ATP-binding protein [Deltaproteobacteria bacterium]|nr:ATP-binding protein [Deltaproteobacteria bacterium]